MGTEQHRQLIYLIRCRFNKVPMPLVWGVKFSNNNAVHATTLAHQERKPNIDSLGCALYILRSMQKLRRLPAQITPRAIVIIFVVVVILYFLLRIPVRNLFRAFSGNSAGTKATATPSITSAPAPTATSFAVPATKPPATPTFLQLPSP